MSVHNKILHFFPEIYFAAPSEIAYFWHFFSQSWNSRKVHVNAEIETLNRITDCMKWETHVLHFSLRTQWFSNENVLQFFNFPREKILLHHFKLQLFCFTRLLEKVLTYSISQENTVSSYFWHCGGRSVVVCFWQNAQQNDRYMVICGIWLGGRE